MQIALHKTSSEALSELQLQPESFKTWQRKYRAVDFDGNPVDETPRDTQARVAHALAQQEVPEKRQFWYNRFLWAFDQGALPAGRILSNAGAEQYKPNTSTINCTVSRTLRDSMSGILDGLHESGRTLRAGCGIGYEFSTLRPKGAFVNGAGSETSGPLPFMDVYDKLCFTIASAGGRRGAQMATFDCSHPDIIEFIKAKREDGRLRQFNCSVLITEDFMEAVNEDADWNLVFPAHPSEMNKHDIVWRFWPTVESFYTVNEKGRVACRVYKTVKARALFDEIMRSNYEFAEPGFLLIDMINEMNNNWFCEDIRATNPCGEQPLPPYGSCLLGSVVLPRFVRDPFTPKAKFDVDTFVEVVRVFTRALDNVVELNGLPLSEQRDEITRKRRHGMGITGLGSALAMMGMRYGSPEAVTFTDQVTHLMAITGLEEGVALAKEKGCAPILEEDFEVTPEMYWKRPEMGAHGLRVGDVVKGKVLWARYSKYLQKFDNEKLLSDLETYGCRFTHHTSIAPTGTISLSFGNNCSNGIEPTFDHAYTRNIIVPGKKAKEAVTVYSYEFLAYRQLVNIGAEKGDLSAAFAVCDDITPAEHIAMQAAAQRWIDSSISKTINVPTGISFEEFKDIYIKAYENGLKGCTTFRFNPEAFQGVLVRDDDLANTVYRFRMEDGTTVEAKGNEMVEYDGQVFTAANLYDAIKESTYGKF